MHIAFSIRSGQPPVLVEGYWGWTNVLTAVILAAGNDVCSIDGLFPLTACSDQRWDPDLLPAAGGAERLGLSGPPEATRQQSVSGSSGRCCWGPTARGRGGGPGGGRGHGGRSPKREQCCEFSNCYHISHKQHVFICLALFNSQNIQFTWLVMVTTNECARTHYLMNI